MTKMVLAIILMIIVSNSLWISVSQRLQQPVVTKVSLLSIIITIIVNKSFVQSLVCNPLGIHVDQNKS